MKNTICIIGIIASLVMIVCSCAMGWRFGYSIGKTELDSIIYGGVSVAADVFLAVGVIYLLWSLEAGKYGRAVASLCLVGLFASYSLTSSAGYTAASRSALVTTENNKTVIYNNNATMMKGDTARLVEVDTELKQLTKKLTQKGYLGRRDRLRRSALAEERDQLKKDIRQYKKDIGLDTVVITQANTVSSQNEFFSRLLNIAPEDVGAFLIGILSIVLLCGASLGLYVSMGALLDRKQEPEKASVPSTQTETEEVYPTANQTVESYVPKPTGLALVGTTDKKKRLGRGLEFSSPITVAPTADSRVDNIVDFPNEVTRLSAKQKRKQRIERKSRLAQSYDYNTDETDLESFIVNNYEHAQEKPKGKVCADYYLQQRDIYQAYCDCFPDTKLSFNKFKKTMPSVRLDSRLVGGVTRSNNVNWYKLKLRTRMDQKVRA